MEAVVGLLVMILGVSHGVETNCDGRQNGTQCYGALGGTVVFRLMDSASEIPAYQWLKKNTVILYGRKDLIVTKPTGTRFSFTPSDGTFRINELNRTDGGEYTLKTFDSGGKELKPRTLQLTIQAPVSVVLLVTECLSQGEMNVSCSSDGGDSLQYSLTLDGRTLTDAELLARNPENNSVTLKQHVSGLLVCSVKNNVSSVSDVEKISTCGYIYINCTENGTHISQWVFEANNTLCIEPTTTPTTTNTESASAGKETGITESNTTNITSSNRTLPEDDPWYISYGPIMAGVLSALVLLLVVGVAVICAQKKKPVGIAAEDDDQELTYADVSILQRPGRQVHQRADTEVEYGQIMFSERPRRQTVQPPADECVYASVRKDR